jgi:excisionase family DNA binding protein
MGAPRNPGRKVQRVTLRPEEAAEALGVSHDFFSEHIAIELRWIRRGRLKLVPVAELTAWAERESALVLHEAA